ncbi:MAG: cytochrome b/b6 domain-containing protein [Sulfurospirillum sp.]|nr:cytochrome b/b6 domain-containing protein [Sulfurospirillum sp.]
MIKSYIWPLSNRIAHILLIVFFAVSYLLGDFDKLLRYHVAFGYAFGVVIAFRIVWAFIGPKYSKLKDFNFSLTDLMAYMLSVFAKTKEYAGHNPASSFAIVGMFVVTFVMLFTGALAYGIQENHGILSFLHNSYFKDMEFFKDVHELSANLFLALIGAHIAGALIDKYIKKSDAIDSMVHGYKTLQIQETIKTNIFQKIIGFVWIIASLYALYYLIFTQDNMFIANANQKQNYAQMHPVFFEECASCHIAYAPYLLPANAWILMMKDLENHFGEDASIDSVANASILAFLRENSAENATHQASVKMLKSLKGKTDIIAITKTPFWEKKHRDIDKNIWNTKEVKSKANCKACHQEIDFGLLENDLIAMPKIKS